jgi:DNA-binding Lrp family transcriptional regulator
MTELKDIDFKIISELMKNSKTSDRQLAKKIDVSQPTVTRRRAQLEKKELLDYTAIPNFKKLGFQIMVFSFSKWTPQAHTELLAKEEFAKQVKRFFSRFPNVIFATTGGSGLGGMDSASISVHKDYSDYTKFMREIKREWGKNVAEFDSFIFSLGTDDVVRPITFKYLGEYINKNR